jgi:cytochrome c556
VAHLFCGFLLLMNTSGGSAPAASGATQTDPLSQAARAAISQRMTGHANQLSQLLKAVLVLDREAVQEYANAIHDSTTLGRPVPGENDTLNSSIPKRFFDLQDQLAKNAKTLSEAARRHDDVQMGTAFGQLTATCVACHAAYMWKGLSHNDH